MTDLALVGDFPSKDEILPFSSRAFQELAHETKLSNSLRLNIFPERPPYNDLASWCVSKKEAKEIYAERSWPDWFPETYLFDKVSQGKYLHPNHLHHLINLRRKLLEANPNLIIAFGSLACWALLNQSGIKKFRGTCTQGALVPNKVLPTYHPNAIYKQFEIRPIILADLLKAKEELSTPLISRPRREVWLNPTLDDLPTWESKNLPTEIMGVDIETVPSAKLITMVGVSSGPDKALVVPFFMPYAGSYWSTAREEKEAILWLKRILNSPWPKVMQNGLYDMAWLWRQFGITVRNALHDTSLLSHSLQPEMEKGLGFQGSIWTNEPSWKLMRKSMKRDDE